MTRPRPPRLRGVTRQWIGPPEPTTPEPAGSCDGGRAIIEVIFLAVLMLIPVTYIMINLLRLQAATLAVTQAARDAGRAIDAAPTIEDGLTRGQQIAAIDLADQHIPQNGLTIEFVTTGPSLMNQAGPLIVCERLGCSSGRRDSTRSPWPPLSGGLLTDRAPAGSPVTVLLMGCRARFGVST